MGISHDLPITYAMTSAHEKHFPSMKTHHLELNVSEATHSTILINGLAPPRVFFVCLLFGGKHLNF